MSMTHRKETNVHCQITQSKFIVYYCQISSSIEDVVILFSLIDVECITQTYLRGYDNIYSGSIYA